jgi:arginyl-tRNA synthetase
MKQAREEAVRLLSAASGLASEQVASLLGEAAVERGEFAFPCFQLAKERKKAPPQIAAEIAAKVERGSFIAEAKAEGPYVNVRVDRATLARRTLEKVARERLGYGGGKDPAAGTVVIDYSSPNVAKPLAFHHLRSTMIGNSLVRLYRAGGWKVEGINHLGDWGTAFGKLLLAWEMYGPEIDLAKLDIEGLNGLYLRVNAAIKEELKLGKEHLEARARAWFKRLEDGDADARTLWKKFVDLSLAEFAKVYALLGVSFEHVWGESFYEDKMPALIDELKRQGLLVTSEGAEVVMLDDAGLPPCLIRKQDGASLYATRDLAAAIYRHDTLGSTRTLYVIDRGQAVHVQQFRLVLAKMGHGWAEGLLHVPFGVVKMGGKKAATRSGSMVLLTDVLDASIAKVKELMAAKNPELAAADPQRAEAVARDVGIGAVVFNDLKNFRENDIDFDLDAITSFEGKTGPYVMYSHARACSILERAKAEGLPANAVEPALLTHDLEHALVRLVAQLPLRVEAARAANDPSIVAKHVLDLCEGFHAYHTAGGRDRALRVLADDPALRAARLALTDAVRQALANALTLLGIAAPTQM